nr:hypothetical protein GCM10025699_74430 [Microbacterium flavescens]
MEVRARLEPGPLLEQGDEEVVGGARVGRRLQDDESTRTESPGEGTRRALDERQIGQALSQRRGDGDDRDVEPVARVVVLGRGQIPARQESPAQHLVGDVVDVRAAGPQRLDAGHVEIDPDDPVPDLDRSHRQGQAHVALTDDDDLDAHALALPAPSDQGAGSI